MTTTYIAFEIPFSEHRWGCLARESQRVTALRVIMRRIHSGVTIYKCLYCSTGTGAHPSRFTEVKATVCHACTMFGRRDEAREIALGMPRWNPAPPWEKHHFGTPAPEVAA